MNAFVGFSLSVQNRHKARRGRSPETAAGGCVPVTRRQARPCRCDQEHTPAGLPVSRRGGLPCCPTQRCVYLAMPGAESICKHRWAQALAEACKIPDKHLLVLEPRISGPQTNPLICSRLQLVVPLDIRGTDTTARSGWPETPGDFIRGTQVRATGTTTPSRSVAPPRLDSHPISWPPGQVPRICPDPA